MNELMELLEMVGISEVTTPSLTKGEDEFYHPYLLKGERIVSLAKEKKTVKTKNLTMRLCDLKYPKLSFDISTSYNQLEACIKRHIRKELKLLDQKEFTDIREIPFFCVLMPREMLFIDVDVAIKTLVENVTGKNKILRLEIGDDNIYIPCNPQKRFTDGVYYFPKRPKTRATIIHGEKILYDFFLIHWFNQIIEESKDNEDINEIVTNSTSNVSSYIKNYRWDSTLLSDWMKNYFSSEGYKCIEGIYTINEEITSPIQNYNECFEEYFFIIECVYKKKAISIYELSNFIQKQKVLPYIFKRCILEILRYFVLSIQNQQIRNHYRKQLNGFVARAYTTKRNIPKQILSAMKTSSLNDYFGFVEFDEDVDLNLVNAISEEFIKLNRNYFCNIRTNDVTFRIRKLGRHKAYGLYYPTLHTLVVDLRNPDAFVHEYFHMLDDMCGEPSLKANFFKIIERYRNLVTHFVKKERDNGKQLLSLNGKYRLDYYLQKDEIFARCGEIHLFRNLNVESSLLKHKDTLSFAYPNDEVLNQLIYDYYSVFLSNLNKKST